jgi:hypothetical protein
MVFVISFVLDVDPRLPMDIVANASTHQRTGRIFANRERRTFAMIIALNTLAATPSMASRVYVAYEANKLRRRRRLPDKMRRRLNIRMMPMAAGIQ